MPWPPTMMISWAVFHLGMIEKEMLWKKVDRAGGDRYLSAGCRHGTDRFFRKERAVMRRRSVNGLTATVLLTTVLLVTVPSVTVFAGEPNGSFSLDELEGLPFPEQARELLRKNGFVVTPGHGNEILDIYRAAKDRGEHIFVTTDGVLHTAHMFFDFLLRIVEIEKLYDLTDRLTERMLTESLEQYRRADDDTVREMARLNVGYFSVARRLLHPECPVPLDLEELVARELSHIEAHQGFAPRALLSYVRASDFMDAPYAFEDYSQYVPRGHYTRNEAFERYFRTMMWYGRIDFKLRPGSRDPALTHGRRMTLQALLITDIFLRDREIYKLWERIYEPTTYFVGRTDDLSVADYIRLVRKVYPAGGPVDKYAAPALLDGFIDEAVRLADPRILSGAAFVEDGEFAATTKGFRFMGQRYIPDSYMFQELVFGVKDLGPQGEKMILRYTGSGRPFTMEYIPNVGPARAFPRGLDIMAVLGSGRALEILTREGDTEYSYYDEQLGRLQEKFAGKGAAEWTQNLYWRWLDALRPLLDEPGDQGWPAFMLSPAWQDKTLQTALGSWTELRHDTILYAKQSTTMMAKAAPPRPKTTRGYVEPYADVYRRLGEMMHHLRRQLGDLGLDLPQVAGKIEQFEELLAALETISKKELGGEQISDEEYAIIRNIGGRLSSLKLFPKEILEKITSGTDEKMDLVADVHTEPNTGQVLEEGVGSPANIYVIVDDAGGRRICRGGVFSYYEFKHPLDDRLTDEVWQQMGEDRRRPDPPPWTASFSAR